MTQVNPTCYHISASSVGAFKACPTRFRLAYREGLRVAEDTESQRVGTNWHAIHEVYQNSLAALPPEVDPPGRALTAVVEHLNEQYANVPLGKNSAEWALERQVLLTCFIGYLWHYSEDAIEYLRQEVPFELPLHGLKTGLPLSTDEVLRVGKIDHVIRWRGMIGALERKSTTRAIDSDSDYWDKARKDTQVSMHALAMRDLGASLIEAWNPNEHSGSTLYDVWRRPTTRPKLLTQAAAAEFISSGTYCDNQFEVTTGRLDVPIPPKDPEKGNPSTDFVTVDGESAEVEQGKKGFAIRETVLMYAARLLAEIQEEPAKFFQRREIARTDKDLDKFRGELFNIYQAQKSMEKNGYWFENEHQCRATFPCQYIPVCYGPGADAVCDGRTTPPGFKRIFVDLTKEGQALSEE